MIGRSMSSTDTLTTPYCLSLIALAGARTVEAQDSRRQKHSHPLMERFQPISTVRRTPFRRGRHLCLTEAVTEAVTKAVTKALADLHGGFYDLLSSVCPGNGVRYSLEST